MVSNDRMLRTIIGFSLALEEFEVREASDANGAHKELGAGFIPSLVVCGCGAWPEGGAIIRQISGHSLLRRSPVLALVSREDLDRQMEWREAGATCLLATPFSSEQLLEMVGMVLFSGQGI